MKYLFLSPHPDDVELACGATIARLVEEKNEIFIAVFSDCDISLQEMYRAHESLGAKTLYFSYTRRTFDKHRQKILDDLIGIRNKFQFDVVFLPDQSDIHQDHQVIGMEGLRCFKNTADIISYAHLHNQFRGSHNLYYEISYRHIEAKLMALNYYLSQRERSYFSKDAIISQLKSNGIQGGVDYAEIFKIIKQII